MKRTILFWLLFLNIAVIALLWAWVIENSLQSQVSALQFQKKLPLHFWPVTGANISPFLGTSGCSFKFLLYTVALFWLMFQLLIELFLKNKKVELWNSVCLACYILLFLSSHSNCRKKRLLCWFLSQFLLNTCLAHGTHRVLPKCYQSNLGRVRERKRCVKIAYGHFTISCPWPKLMRSFMWALGQPLKYVWWGRCRLIYLPRTISLWM